VYVTLQRGVTRSSSYSGRSCCCPSLPQPTLSLCDASLSVLWSRLFSGLESKMHCWCSAS